MSWTSLTVTWTNRAEKDLRGLPKKVESQIRQGVADYAATGVGDITKMQNGTGYRIRVRSWRVLCDIDWSGLTLRAIEVPKRGDAY